MLKYCFSIRKQSKLLFMSETKEEKEIWREIKEIRQEINDLRKEMYQEFKQVREEIHRLDLRISSLDKKFTILFPIVIFLIVFLNQNTLEFLLKLLGIIK